jgi:hypothetical protein
MTSPMQALRVFEGQQICVALVDGTRIDDCTLVSAGRGRAATMWVFAAGGDTFLRHDDVLDVWPYRRAGRQEAA